MTPLPSLKLSVRRFEGVGLTGGQSQVEPPCALGCEWVLGCWRQASEQPSVSPGGICLCWSGLHRKSGKHGDVGICI